jgi:putative sigma-54 modulation protein
MNRIIEVNVIMDIQKLDHFVELIMKAGNLKITSQASSTDMYASIDKAVARLEAQLRRYKSKLQDHHAKGHAVLNMKVDVIQKPEEDDDFNEEESGDGKALQFPKVINQESIPLKTLTQDEAVMKMELSNDNFMLFKNEVDHKLKVIYRKKDGNYGIIEPNS